MVRTVVAIPEDDKRWLDRQAAEQGLPMTELVRRAIASYRMAGTRPTFEELLDAVKGTWKHGDGLRWQEALRGEWADRTP